MNGTQLKQLTLADATAQFPAAIAAWDPSMGPIGEAQFHTTDGTDLAADAECDCPGHSKHPYVWGPELPGWDAL